MIWIVNLHAWGQFRRPMKRSPLIGVLGYTYLCHHCCSLSRNASVNECSLGHTMSASDKAASSAGGHTDERLSVGRPTPITIDHVRQDMAEHISHVLSRPSIYFGPPSLRAAQLLEAVLWHLFIAWAGIDHRNYEFKDLLLDMQKRNGCTDSNTNWGSFSLDEVCRRNNPDATEEEVFEFVRQQGYWIADEMGGSQLST